VHAAGLNDVTVAALSTKKNRNKTMTSQSASSQPAAAESTPVEPVKVLLRFKRNVYDPRKQMLQ